MNVITEDRARQSRAREAENALASVRLEGLEPGPEAKVLFQRYVDGALTSEDLDEAFHLYLEREHGPVRLPEYERS